MTNLPVTGEFRVTCEYGKKGNLWSSGYHKGIDLVCNNRNIYCTCDGTVKTVEYDTNGWGQYVRVDDGKGRIHIFCHLVKGGINVKVGQKVSRSTILGTMGSTGNSTGIHLHYQIEDAKRNVYDPTEWLGIPNKVGTYDSADYHIKEESKVAEKDYKGHWGEKAIQSMIDKKIMVGDGKGKFRPNENITRAEVAQTIENLLKYLAK